MGYLSAHDAVDISTMLENLEMTDTEDQDIVLKLTTSNANLKEVVKTLIEQLGVDMSTIQQLTKVTR